MVRADGDNDEDDASAVDASAVSEEDRLIQQNLPSFNMHDTQATIPVVHEKADFFLAYSTVPGKHDQLQDSLKLNSSIKPTTLF